MKCCLWLDFLRASLFISMYRTLVEIITLSGIYERGISVSAYMLGKRDIISAASSDLYLFVWQRYAVCIYHPFSNFPPVTVHDLNWSVRQAWNILCTKNWDFFYNKNKSHMEYEILSIKK